MLSVAMRNEHRRTLSSWLSYTILLCKTSYRKTTRQNEIIKTEELASKNEGCSFHNWWFSLMNVEEKQWMILEHFHHFKEKNHEHFFTVIKENTKNNEHILMKTMNTFWWNQWTLFDEINEHFLMKTINMFDEKQWTILWL